MKHPEHISLRNQWRIPRVLALEVAVRDQKCVYCGGQFSALGKFNRNRASWEHIVNDLALITPENIAVSCVGCNASKGKQTLVSWLASDYCARYKITETSLALVAQLALAREVNTSVPAQTAYSAVFPTPSLPAQP